MAWTLKFHHPYQRDFPTGTPKFVEGRTGPPNVLDISSLSSASNSSAVVELDLPCP